jgi:NADPH:quinone reductase-like Zn-dependent oxidoreductase
MSMLAWTLGTHGEPSTAFSLQEHREPVPGSHEVLIRCEGFGLNYADVMASRGLYREAPPLPSILGYEVVGTVVQCGEHADRQLMGKRVVALTHFGGYAQMAVADHRAVAVIPDTISLGEAAALATQGCTAWYAAHWLCPLHPLERVLVHSAAGGVGQLLVQLALAQGCEVYAIASGADKLAFIRSMGVTHVFDRAQRDVYPRIRSALGGRKMDVSFNAVGGSTFREDLSILGHGGRLVMYGGSERDALKPFGTLRFVLRMGVVVPIFLMMRSQSLLGLNMLKISRHRPELLAHCLKHSVEAYRSHILRPYVHKEYPHTELPLAIADLAGSGTIGKLVVKW